MKKESSLLALAKSEQNESEDAQGYEHANENHKVDKRVDVGKAIELEDLLASLKTEEFCVSERGRG